MVTLNASVAEPSRQVLASIECRRMEDRQSWDTAMRKGFAGGVAGCAILYSQFIHYAISWRGLLGVAQDIRQLQGIRALFQGHSAILLRVFPFSGTNFLAYEQFRSDRPRLYIADLLQKSGWGSLYLSDISPGIDPGTDGLRDEKLWVVIFLGKGLLNYVPWYCWPVRYCWFLPGPCTYIIGYSPILWILLRVPMLAPYTTITSTRTRENNAIRISGSHSSIRLTITAQLFSGAMAGLVVQTISYPLEMIRRRMQVCNPLGTNRRVAIAETAITIFRERGLGGFFFGLPIGYLKVAPMMATSFFVYDRMRWYLGLYNT
ncbi:unnamed protein product, partial [Clonostachys rosea f. rosea IK726]